MPDVLVLADPLSAGAFALCDFDVQTVDEADITPRHLREAMDGDYRVVFITENLAAPVREELQRVQEKSRAILTVIPGAGTTLNLGEHMLLELRKTVSGI